MPKKITTEQFIKRAQEIHGDIYSYSKVIYKSMHSKVTIICHIHGEFTQEPNSHIRNQGCPKCAKENKGGWSYSNWKKSANKSKNFDSFKVYIIKCWNDKEEFCKIGKTFTKIEKRFSHQQIPYNYEIIKIFEGNAAEISVLENKLQTENKSNKYIPNIKFTGMYECFKNIK